VEEVLGLAGGCLGIDDHGEALVGPGTEPIPSAILLRFSNSQTTIIHGLEADIPGLGTANTAITDRI